MSKQKLTTAYQCDMYNQKEWWEVMDYETGYSIDDVLYSTEEEAQKEIDRIQADNPQGVKSGME
jgi:hypothetical protein|tara:strand:- start:1967 stop:2158 length:192 start_codon:yes stop_codon:yes gene_type:complete